MPPNLTATRSRPAEFLSACCAITLGVAMTLALRGYQFGHSNHTVYLIDALRHNHPELLANDWFATHTLQYHVVFTRVTAALDRAGLLRPAFLVGYLLLAALLHVVWLLWVRALGGSSRAYLLSVILYLLSAGGFGLGMYEFLQDSSFLPSNVANVAMLAALYCWTTGRPTWSGLLFGVAGFFHLNHALLGIAIWFTLIVWDLRSPSSRAGEGLGVRGTPRRPNAAPLAIGTLLLLALALPNILPALRAALAPRPKIPLREFVDLYVHLRHPHHYDPLSWPIALWLSFLWPFPLAWIAWRRSEKMSQLQATARITLLFCAVLLVGLLFAGVWYVSEPLVQMSLFRFSIYPKLLTCIGAGLCLDRVRRPLVTFLAVLALGAASLLHRFEASLPPDKVNLAAVALFGGLASLGALFELAPTYLALTRAPRAALHAAHVGLIVLALVGLAFTGQNGFAGMGVARLPTDPPDYLAVCDYARKHTPTDAVFLVPPSEEEFRLAARRAIVINFKGVPQLSSELGEWRDRLCRVLDLPDLNGLPRRMDRTLAAIGLRYDELSAAQLMRAAQTYHARYVVATHAVDFGPAARLVFEKGAYHLYDLAPQGNVKEGGRRE